MGYFLAPKCVKTIFDRGGGSSRTPLRQLTTDHFRLRLDALAEVCALRAQSNFSHAAPAPECYNVIIIIIIVLFRMKQHNIIIHIIFIRHENCTFSIEIIYRKYILINKY